MNMLGKKMNKWLYVFDAYPCGESDYDLIVVQKKIRYCLL